MIAEVDYRALLGITWAEMDCRAAVREVYALAGIALPPGALDYPPAGCWERIADRWDAGTKEIARALDVIASDPHGRGCESHVSVLIRSGRPWTALSSSEREGVHAGRPWAIQNVLGVYRLKAGAA